MFKKFNLKSRRIFLLIVSFVLLISLSSCGGAGNPLGKLNPDEIYASAGKYSVTNQELWNELKWSAKDVLDEKITEVVLKDYFTKIELVMEKSYASLTDDEKKSFKDDFTEEDFNQLYQHYSVRLKNYVLDDVYNFDFNVQGNYDSIEDIAKYDAKLLRLKYSDEMYSLYNIDSINGKSLVTLCEEATLDNDNFLIIAKQFKNLYYTSLAKELLAYDKLDEEIKDAYENRDTDDENDLGYFTKNDYIQTYKNEYANQGDLNLILIRFASEEEFNSTLKSFGLKFYRDDLVYIEKRANMSFAEYANYYDEFTPSDGKDGFQYIERSYGEVAVLELYIQIYNYLYGGYREMLYTDKYKSYFNDIDLTPITEDIIQKYAQIMQQENSEQKLKEAFDAIVAVLAQKKDDEEVFNTYYTREYIDNLDPTFYLYLYEELSTPFTDKDSSEDDSKSYSTALQTYSDQNWIAFKLEQESDQYENIYHKDITDDELYENITANETLYNEISDYLRTNALTSTNISNALTEETEEVTVKIYDEALEIAYATSNSEYSKTYGSAPNSNVIATIAYNNQTYHVNIVEDTEDSKAVSGGIFTELELKNGITTSIDILSKKIVKDTKAYEDTAKDKEDYYQQIEYILAAFSSDSLSSSGYPSSIGKYNFLMLYYHTANIDDIVKNVFRVNAASGKLLTDYASNTLLNFFKTYTDSIYENYFSISGKRLVVYMDANDDGEKDNVADWKDLTYNNQSKGSLAQELVLEILKEVQSMNGSHATALDELVTEINNSARAEYQDNPIAPENKWAKYRKAGLNVALEDVSAANDTTSIDFKLKERLVTIFKQDDFKINNTTQTEYLERLTAKEDVLQTEDGFNLLVITSAEFQTSAEFTSEDDPLHLFESVDVYYNDAYVTIDQLYNDSEKLSINQIKLYVLEYVSQSTSNLSPSAISDALSNYLSPVLTRYMGEETQRDIVLYFIQEMAGSLTFTNQAYAARMDKIIEINHNAADNYIFIYEEDPTGTLNTYEHWWEDLKSIIAEILFTQGEE